MKQFYSLRSLQLIYGFAFLLLLSVSAIGGLLAFQASERSSMEAQRVGTLLKTVELTRGDLYRQLKEVFDFHFLQDADADVEFDELGKRSQTHFETLQTLAVTDEERIAIEELIKTYQTVNNTIIKIMSLQRGQIPQSEKLVLLDTELEGENLSDLEAAFGATEHLFVVAQTELQSNVKHLIQTALALLLLPILIAAALLLFARIFLDKAFVKPLANILSSMQIFGKGNLKHHAIEQGANEMVDLQRAINDMASELEKSRSDLIQNEKEAALGALVPVIAHNIRNPLASIRATAEVSNLSTLSPEIHQSFTDIIGAVDRLEKWILSLFNFLDPSKPDFQICQIQQCVDNALSLIPWNSLSKEISIAKTNWDNPSQIRLDINLMEQAIYGLITNAIEASPTNTEIRLTVDSDQNSMELTIEDDGSGFLFEPGQITNLRGPTTKAHGSGLGIPFAHKVCELHNGHLSFENRKNFGTSVTISLPLSKSE